MLAAALLSPGGLFVPCLCASAGLTWGIAGGAGKALSRRQPGMVLVASLAAVMFVLGMAPVVGLATWSSSAFDLPDPLLHVTAGFFLVMALVWLMGKGGPWRRGLAVAIAVAAGGAAELAQQFASRRGGEWSDWFWHCVGCAGGTAVYLLAAGAKGCEHPDAPAPAATSDVAQYPMPDGK
jgi:VanZ family protein